MSRPRSCCTAGCPRSSARPHCRTGCAATRCAAHPAGDRQAGRRRIRPSAARYPGAGDAGFVEGNAAAVRRPPAPGARQQDRRADHRFRRHRPPGIAADVGQAPARLPGDGLPDIRRPTQKTPLGDASYPTPRQKGTCALRTRNSIRESHSRSLITPTTALLPSPAERTPGAKRSGAARGRPRRSGAFQPRTPAEADGHQVTVTSFEQVVVPASHTL
jgi:hypothetical protein